MEELRGNTMIFVFLLFLHVTFSFFEVSTGEHSMMPMHYAHAEPSDEAGYDQERLSSVLVTGSITCVSFNKDPELIPASYVAGAKLAVSCKDAWKRRKITWISGTTDEYGDFIVDLPSRLHGIPRLEASCVVKILQLPKESSCHHKHLRKSTRIKLSSVGNSIRVYTTETIRLENRNV